MDVYYYAVENKNKMTNVVHTVSSVMAARQKQHLSCGNCLLFLFDLSEQRDAAMVNGLVTVQRYGNYTFIGI